MTFLLPTISPSAVRDYNLCPRRYALSFCGLEKPFYDALHVGNALHSVAAFALASFKQDGELPTRVRLDQELERALNHSEQPIPAGSLERMRGDAQYKLERLLEVLTGIVARFRLCGVEQWVKVLTRDELGEVVLRGRLDILLYDEERNAFVIYDLKTSGYNAEYVDFGPLALCVTQVQNDYPEHSVLAYAVYLEGTERFVPYLPDSLEQDLLPLVQTARAAYADQVFSPNRGVHCAGCPFLEHCQTMD